jgi:hypothetical protein
MREFYYAYVGNSENDIAAALPIGCEDEIYQKERGNTL